MGSLNNAGTVDVENGSTLTINGAVDNSGNLYTNQQGIGGNNTINIGGMLTNEAGGVFTLNGPTDMATIGTPAMPTSMSNAGTVDLENGSSLTVNGTADNSWELFTSSNGGTGHNTVNVTGALTNEGTGEFILSGPGDLGTLGSLSNAGFVDLENGSKLQVTNDVNNSGSLFTSFILASGGNAINIGGGLTNSGGFALYGPGDTATIGGNVNNSGALDVEGGSTLQIGGNVTNSGMLETNATGVVGMNTIAITGTLTNTLTGQITLNGPGDLLQVNGMGGLTNNGVINVNNGSSIDPQSFTNLGTLNIDGTSRFVVGTPTPMGGQGYIQLANGTLNEIINGYGPCGNGNCGLITVNGSALLAGTLDIMLKAGFNPTVGSEFTILTASPGQLSGKFSSILGDIFNGGTEMWAVTYDSNDGLLELTAQPNGSPVPEPATLLVLVPGLMAAGYGLRRKLFR